MYLHRLVGTTLGNKYCVVTSGGPSGGLESEPPFLLGGGQAVADIGGVHPPHQRYLISDIIKFLIWANDKNFGGGMLSQKLRANSSVVGDDKAVVG